MPTISQQEAVKMGIPKHTLQTIEIPKEIPLSIQRTWLKKNGYVHSYHRQTAHYTRWMQTFPIKQAEYHSKKLVNIFTRTNVDTGEQIHLSVILVYQNYASPSLF